VSGKLVKRNRFSGLASLMQRKQSKYRGCEHAKVYGIPVRKLTEKEIEEFRAGVAGISLTSIRRSIV
jgi:hypothetical protein